MARIELWNGDICDLEVDAIVNAANMSLWMSTGVVRRDQAGRRRCDRVRGGPPGARPARRGDRDARPAGSRREVVIHAVSLDRDRRTSGEIIDRAVRSAMARARELRVASIAFPAMGTGVGGFPLDEAARVTVRAVRDELAAVAADRARDLRDARRGGLPRVRGGARRGDGAERRRAGSGGARPAAPTPIGRGDARMSMSYERSDEQRDELVERVAREIQLRGLTGPAVHFLEASRPYRPLGANAMLFFDPVLRGLFGGEDASASEILADDAGIELLIARLEEIDEEITWDA